MAEQMTRWGRFRGYATNFLGAALGASVAAPTKTQLTHAEAYVDPSRLIGRQLFTPYNPSELVTRKGLTVFDRMKRDEQVKACLSFKKAVMLSTGWEVVSPGDQEEDWEVTTFVSDNFKYFRGGWAGALRKMMLAIDYGYSCTEKVYGDVEWASGKLALTRLSSVKPHYFDFDVSATGELLALLQRYVPGPSQEQVFSPAKFVVYTHDSEFENYYGRSDLEAAYRAWWVKDNAYKWLAVFLERYGMAPLIAMYNANVYTGGQVDELKNVVKNVQNATMGLLPRIAKDDLELWSQQLSAGSKDIFLGALGRFDADIGKALLVPSLIGAGGDSTSSGEGQRGSYARSQTHFDLFLKAVEDERKALAADAVNSQVVPQLCDLNWPGLKSYPEFRFLPLDDGDKNELYTLWSQLVAGKVVNRIEDDETHIRKALGMPENDDPTIEELPDPIAPPGNPAAELGAKDKKPKPVPKDQQSAEMKKFAEEHDAVWVDVEGDVVCFGERRTV